MAHHLFTYYGGGEKLLYTEAQLLKNNGHEVFFFATDKKPYIEPDYQYSKFFPKYIDYQSLSRFEALKYSFKTFYNVEAEKKLDLYLQEISPDIVHCHNIFYYLTPSILNVCYKANIPVVMTLHDTRLACPAATLMIKNEQYCQNEMCVSGKGYHCILNKCKYNSLIASTLVSTEYYFRKLHKLYNGVSKFICPSKALANLIIKTGIKESKIEVINNFVNKNYFDTKPEYTNKGYFLYAGRLDKVKGLDILLKTMKTLPDITLHIAGTGPEEDNLKIIKADLNLSNVHFLGYLMAEELENEYKNCIATILPSNWFENFPVSIIESFVYGKPVIGANVGGIPEMIETGINGLVFELKDVNQLANAIKKLSLDNKLVIEMGKNARQKAELLYGPQLHYEKLISSYQTLINR